jgi:hypothetical protein
MRKRWWLGVILTIFVLVGFAYAQSVDPAKVIESWQQIHTGVWQTHPYYDYHDYYYIDPEDAEGGIACHTTACPKVGGGSYIFVYRTKDRTLLFWEWSDAEKKWKVHKPTVPVESMEQWHKDFDEAWKKYLEGKEKA